MPLMLPDLDDRRFTDLLAEGRGLIPAYAPDWTNHNEADPGITLIEMFAFLTEMLIYRVNRVTAATTLEILQLLNGPGWLWKPEATGNPSEQMAEQIRLAVLGLREMNRAITLDDFERLALQANPLVRRARCLARRDLEAELAGEPAVEKPGHVSLIIVPGGGAPNPQPGPELISSVRSDLEPRRLLATHIHVVGPRYFSFGVRLSIVLKPDALEENFLFELESGLKNDLDGGSFSDSLREAFGQHQLIVPPVVAVQLLAVDEKWLIIDKGAQTRYGVRLESGKLNVYEYVAMTAAVKALWRYFDPLTGGKDERGWPFGRNIYVSELYQILDGLPGVDFVRRSLDQNGLELAELTVDSTQQARLQFDKFHNLSAVELMPEELVDVAQMAFDLTIFTDQGL